jgi:hypothetical protein
MKFFLQPVTGGPSLRGLACLHVLTRNVAAAGMCYAGGQRWHRDVVFLLFVFFNFQLLSILFFCQLQFLFFYICVSYFVYFSYQFLFIIFSSGNFNFSFKIFYYVCFSFFSILVFWPIIVLFSGNLSFRVVNFN